MPDFPERLAAPQLLQQQDLEADSIDSRAAP
jgi:hypothetical protein